MDYSDLLDALNIRDGETLYVASDITNFALKMVAKHRHKFDANKLIDGMIEKIGNGTLIFPLYNWDFCKGITFDYKNTPGKTGALGNVALARNDFKRTKHPLYSFAVYGQDQDYLCSLDNISSFGLDSPFHYLVERHARQIGIDLEINNFVSYCYYVEEQTNFPLRFMKYFEADYIDEAGIISRRKYSMYVRHLELGAEYDASELFNIMKEENVFKEKVVDGVNIKDIDIHDSYSFFYDDLVNNQGKMSYKLVEPLKSIESIYEELSGLEPQDMLSYVCKWLPELNIYDENHADAYIAGLGDEEIIMPVSFAPDKLSGIVLAIGAARYIKSVKDRKYNYKFVFVPESVM